MMYISQNDNPSLFGERPEFNTNQRVKNINQMQVFSESTYRDVDLIVQWTSYRMTIEVYWDISLF